MASARPRAIRSQHSHIIRPYRPRCLESKDRPPQKRVRSRDPKVFECTNRCGQSFPGRRKGDWTRHERVNFEDWICPECTRSLRRREKLCDHLKKSHGMEGASLDQYRRQFLAPSERPCGFCPAIFHDWSEWLRHVGGHFEGSNRSQRRKMSEWTERRNTQTNDNSDPQLSIQRGDRADGRDDEFDFGMGDASDGAAGDISGSNTQPLYQTANIGASGALAISPELLHQTSNKSSVAGILPPSLGSQQTLSQQIYQKQVAAECSRDTLVQHPPAEDQKLQSEYICEELVATDHVRGYTPPDSCAEDRETPVQHVHEEPVVFGLPCGDKIPLPCAEDREALPPHISQRPAVTDHCPDDATPHSRTEDQGTPFQDFHSKQVGADCRSVARMLHPFPEDPQPRLQQFRTEPLGTPIDNDLIRRVANLDVSEAGIEYCHFNWATASDVSCSCTSCEQRLHLGTSAVDALPRAMNSQGGCRKIFIQQSYHLQQYLRSTSLEDFWSSEARMGYNVKMIRPRSHL